MPFSCSVLPPSSLEMISECDFPIQSYGRLSPCNHLLVASTSALSFPHFLSSSFHPSPFFLVYFSHSPICSFQLLSVLSVPNHSKFASSARKMLQKSMQSPFQHLCSFVSIRTACAGFLLFFCFRHSLSYSCIYHISHFSLLNESSYLSTFSLKEHQRIRNHGDLAPYTPFSLVSQ